VDWVREHIDPFPKRLIVAHLGSGCSITAVLEGRSVDTSMGFTPLEGLMMGTRSGSVDPGLLLHLQAHHGVTAPDLEDTLMNRSGLLGVSAVGSDMRQVLEAADGGNANAKLAYDMFILYARRAAVPPPVFSAASMRWFFRWSRRAPASRAADISAAFEGLQVDAAANTGVGEA
jgi:acetate kinase